MSEPRSPYDASQPPPRASLLADADAHERWLKEAVRFMVEWYGRPIDMDSEEPRDVWHARLGLLAHFINWEAGQ